MPVNRDMERPPRKTVQPQDIWLCLGSLIKNVNMWYVLPERGCGLTVDGDSPPLRLICSVVASQLREVYALH
jgi:hypothetical protein